MPNYLSPIQPHLRAVGKTNSSVSWAATATDNSEAEETKTSLMNSANGNNGNKHAPVGSRNSVGFNNF